MAFFSAPDLALQAVTHDRVLVRSDANVQHNIVTWIHCGPRLNVDLAPFSMVVDDALNAHHATGAKASGYEAQKRNSGRIHWDRRHF